MPISTDQGGNGDGEKEKRHKCRRQAVGGGGQRTGQNLRGKPCGGRGKSASENRQHLRGAGTERGRQNHHHPDAGDAIEAGRRFGACFWA
ncbi:hypothetical protein D3C71_1966760 [compost metagenome]